MEKTTKEKASEINPLSNRVPLQKFMAIDSLLTIADVSISDSPTVEKLHWL